MRTVPQLPDIHTGAATDMLLPIERLNGIGTVLELRIYIRILFHKYLSLTADFSYNAEIKQAGSRNKRTWLYRGTAHFRIMQR